MLHIYPSKVWPFSVNNAFSLRFNYFYVSDFYINIIIIHVKYMGLQRASNRFRNIPIYQIQIVFFFQTVQFVLPIYPSYENNIKDLIFLKEKEIKENSTHYTSAYIYVVWHHFDGFFPNVVDLTDWYATSKNCRLSFVFLHSLTTLLFFVLLGGRHKD